MKKRTAWLLMALVLAGGGGGGGGGGAIALAQGGAAGTAPATGPSELPIEKQRALINATQGSFVVVEYTLQYDKGEPPQGSEFAERCPFCGNYHAERVEDVIREERPLERAGVLVDGTHVVTSDIQLHPRFIKSIKVRKLTADGKSEQHVAASVSAYPRNQNSMILELAEPLGGGGVKAATFDPKRPGPYSLVAVDSAEGRWSVGLQGFSTELMVSGDKSFFSAPSGLIVDREGVAVAMSTGLELPGDGSWKANPMQWPAISNAAMKELLANVEAQAARGIVRVTLNFRSPKNAARSMDRFSMGQEGDATVQHVLGVMTDDRTVLVLNEMKPTTTARLERIRVFTDPPVDAKFSATLQDYGALVATTDKPVSGGPGLSKADIVELRGSVIPAADIYLQGEKRVAYVQPRRIAGFDVGWRGYIYPQIPEESHGMFLFDPEGRLLAIPISQREKVSTSERYRPGDNKLTSIAQVAKALATLKENSDPNNVPLAEEEENRLAWIGVEMQALSRELARANNVSDQTNDGETGGLVTYVYPESPAAKAGVETGWVLLRIDVEGQPKPIDIRVEGDRFGDEPFPWDRLSEVPESVFDRIPTPWPGAETPLIRTLTDLGFGKKFVAEFAHGGKVEKKEFAVMQGPTNYESAAKYKHIPLGLTVRDLTYEVRRYMQKKPEDPGVIISKIELGSKASNSGLKPYEVITHVNDQPVANVKDFERLSKDQTELRLSVKRMNNGRIVKVTVPGTAPVNSPTATQKN